MPAAAPSAPLVLVADVGGTNTRVALARGTTLLPETVRRYANHDFANLAPVLERFCADQGGMVPDGACIAVAGPVADGQAELTNLAWSIDRTGLIAATGARHAAILNDLQAQGYALSHLAPDSIVPVVAPAGEARSAATARLVIGVGTGFNAAPVHGHGAGHLVPPGEAGHATLPVRSETDLRLATFLSSVHGFAAVEDVLSGRGLENVYRWLAADAGAEETTPKAAEIMDRLGTESRSEATVQHVVRILGAVAGDLTLIHLALGGVFLVGGVARALGPHLGPMGFAEAFRDKGRFGPLLAEVPVSLVTDDYAALTGCAGHLAELAL